MIRRRMKAGAVVATAVLLTSCGSNGVVPSDGSPASTASAAPGSVAVLGTRLQAPWSVAFHDRTALISERDSARIVEVGGGGAVRQVGIVDGVAPRGEGGLLGIAVRDRQLYAYYTAAGENRIDRFPITGQAGSLGLGPAERILGGLPAASNHNGGRIAFGPDGMLYVTSGDAGNRDAAQDRASLAGKILRLTPTGEVPPDNPFPGSPVYSLGHRNPQGLAWDRRGRLFASEFGQNTWDELNIITPGGNYGWPRAEGIAGRDGFIDPVQQWAPADASPSGIAIRGDTVYIAALRGKRLIEVPTADPGRSVERLVDEYGRLRDVVLTPQGELWVLTNNTDGRGSPAPDDDKLLRVAP